VSGAEGSTGFGGGGYFSYAPYLAAGLLAVAIVLIISGKVRR
jgi:hypothetical protein